MELASQQASSSVAEIRSMTRSGKAASEMLACIRELTHNSAFFLCSVGLARSLRCAESILFHFCLFFIHRKGEIRVVP